MNAIQAKRLQTNRYARWDAGGEGSRGGKIIGHTSSGKPIYLRTHPSHKMFTAKEHEEAAAEHDRLATKFQGTQAGKHFVRQRRAHLQAADPEGSAFAKSAIEARIGKKSTV